MPLETFETVEELIVHLNDVHERKPREFAGETLATLGWRHDGWHAFERRTFGTLEPTSDGSEPPG